MAEINTSEITRKATSSVIFLSLRNFGLQAVSLVGFFILTLLLGTGEVGLFAIVAESVAIFAYFSDVGLASALIQQKKPISQIQLRTTFFIQQSLVIIALLIVLYSYPKLAVAKNYGLPETLILTALCFSFLTASLKTIPSVLLERHLNFKTISLVDIVENVSFYLVAVIFALLGFGVYSYAIATVVRSALGLFLIYHYQPWPIGISFSLHTAKKLFRYGIPFQFNSLIAMAKDRLSTIVVAGILGRVEFGFLSWSQKGPRIPLSFMDAVMRVTFPAFSRLRQQPELLKRSLEKSVFFIAYFVFPLMSLLVLVAPHFIDLIPKYNKWQPALLPMYLFCLNYSIAAITTPITNAFNATGKIFLTSKFMIMWTVLTWIFYPLLTAKFGFVGTAIAALIVSSSSFIVWYFADKIYSVNLYLVVGHPFIASVLALSIGLYILDTYPQNPLMSIITGSLIFTAFYLSYSYLFLKSHLLWFINQLKKSFNVT
ncbi:MAG: oligosaccharide flippase family protein [Candidatus Shapirobacteria bacterium]